LKTHVSIRRESHDLFSAKKVVLRYDFPVSDITLVLDAINRGESQASEKLLPLVYDELRNLATARMLQESAGHTLQPTALVHEAWLRLVGDSNKNWKSQAYFFAAAAEAMRRILVEHARRKARLKYGGGQQRLNIEDLELAEAPTDDKILLVDEALEHLERTNPERARVVVLKFFGGMTNKEVADTMNTSERSVDRHWVCAKAWLFQKLQNGW
jgi:RNA polymerase sigma factor (TIGR02999 family)